MQCLTLRYSYHHAVHILTRGFHSHTLLLPAAQQLIQCNKLQMKIYLAPMEGLADVYLRSILTAAGGFDLVITEFVRVVDRLLPERVFLRQIPELNHKGFTVAGVPVRVQLLGNHPQALADNAAQACSLGSKGIDLNFGCPSKTVNKSKGGAILLKEPESIFKAVAAVRSHLPAQIPVSAKMRLGYDDSSLMWQCAEAIAEAGATELTVHARTKEQGYRPPAYWSMVSDFERRLGLPVIINGEIWSSADARQATRESCTQAIMLGRGAVRNPLLASQIKQKAPNNTQWSLIKPLLRQFWQMVCSEMTERYCAGRLKQWLNHLRMIYPEAEALYQDIRTVNDRDQISVQLARRL